MKKAVLIIFLVGFCKVFAAFEFDILGQLTASINFPMIIEPDVASYTKSSAAANFGVALQIGNQFSIPPKNLRSGRPMEAPIFNRGNQYSAKEIKGVSVFFDLRIEQETIALGNNSLTQITNTNSINMNMYKMTGLNLGAGITTKFIFGSVNSLVPRDTILGFSLGAKLLVNLFGVDAAMLGVGARPVITPYIDLFVEQRFFVARKFALVGGINIGADIMIAFLNENLRDFFVYNNVLTIYPSLNIGFSLGLHFGH